MTTIDDVIGQRKIWQRLTDMADNGHLPHAMLFTGPQGCGKLPVALAFASHLLHYSPLLTNYTHPDLHFTYPTIKDKNAGAERQPVSDDYAEEWRRCISASPYITIEQWLEAMRVDKQQAVITGAESDALGRKLSLKASQGGYKISLIWLPERMNATSANKLLKILEEPPAQTVFILVSEQPDNLIETIRSRTQRIVFPPIEQNDITTALIERRGIDPQTAERVARIAVGSWNTAIEMLRSDNERTEFFEIFTQLMRMAYQRKVGELKKWSETVASFGREKQKRLLAYFGGQIRENFIYNFRQPDLIYMTDKEEQFSTRFARFINEANVIPLSELMQKAYRDISQNANAKIVFFELTLQTIVLLIKK